MTSLFALNALFALKALIALNALFALNSLIVLYCCDVCRWPDHGFTSFTWPYLKNHEKDQLSKGKLEDKRVCDESVPFDASWSV